MKFISGIWQIHPFREGNTRTVAVFLIQYLRGLGLDINYQPFQDNSRFLRDALVLDNANLSQKDSSYLTHFFNNLLLGGKFDLTTETMSKTLGLD